MNDPTKRVLDVSRTMLELQRRLDELNAERTAIQARLADCMEQLGIMAGGQLRPPEDSMRSTQVLWVLRAYSDGPMSPMDIARVLHIRGAQELTNLRVVLSRMARAGNVRRIGHGRYVTIEK